MNYAVFMHCNVFITNACINLQVPVRNDVSIVTVGTKIEIKYIKNIEPITYVHTFSSKYDDMSFFRRN